MQTALGGNASAWRRLVSRIMTDDFRQRRRLTTVLMTAVLYAAGMALLVCGVVLDIIDGKGVLVLALLCLLTAATFFAIVRSGLNLRFAEPSLVFPQAVIAQALAAAAYAISGPAHAAYLLFLAMVMFFGMFDLGMRNLRILKFYTIGLIGAVMAWCAHVDPENYPPALELLYFATTATALPAISLLSVQLLKMRGRLHIHKQELEAALAHIRLVATHDELTALANRRHMIALLGEHITRHARGGPGFSVALADIDHFKNVNDTYGHRVGDEALVAFAVQARAQLRSTDIIARWGGEEFLLLLPEAVQPADPNVGVERLRAALAVAQASAQAPQLRIAFSTGMTRYIDGEPMDDMIERADRALYAAKAGGRNRTAML